MCPDFFDAVGTLALGSRLKRLGESLMADGRVIYQSAGIDFEPRWFPLFFLLREYGQTTVTEVAASLGVPHPYVSQLVKEMRRAKLIVFRRHPDDGRSRIVQLSAQGETLAEKVEPVWRDIRMAIDTVLARVDVDALRFLGKMEEILAVTPMSSIIAERHRAQRRHEPDSEPAAPTERSPREIQIRLIEPGDNIAMAGVIRTVMPEIGAAGAGFAMHDPEVDAMYEAYHQGRAAYFVVTKDGQVMGGGGFAPLRGADRSVCELQKLYFLPAIRGLGVGRTIVLRCLEVARQLGYKRCYLETLAASTHAAQRLYERLGFVRIPGAMGSTGHYSCDTFFVKELMGTDPNQG